MLKLTALTPPPLLLLLLTFSDARVDISGVPVQSARGVIGGEVALPCPAMKPAPGDKLELALWYRHDSSSPFYTYDARGRPRERGKHMTDELAAPRGRVRLTFAPWGLTVAALQERDAGLYVCRAEFTASSTRTSVTQLQVIVPPGEPIIFDDRRRVVTNWTAPVLEGQSLFLTCEVSRGRPPPQLSWSLEGRQLEAAVSVSPAGTVRSDLALSGLSRRQLAARLRCSASNTNLTQSRSAVVRLDMLLVPLVSRLTEAPAAVSAGSVYQLACRTAGSRPPAHISWTVDGTPVTSGTVEKVSSDGNVTTSSFSLTVPRTSEPLRVICSAQNSQLPHSNPVTDSRRLVVHYQPKVTLQFGRSLDPNLIKEGNDVYFECDVQAHPAPEQLVWFHQGRRLQPSRRQGVLVHERSLVLPNVSMAHSGEYSCQATNSEGQTRSNPVQLRVLYAPRCERASRRIHFLPGREVEIVCRVTAQPQKVRFKWFINRSTAARETIEPSRYTSSEGSSVLRYTLGAAEYAVIGCSSSNAVGLQRRPCLFQMLPASIPGQLRQCQVHNQTVTSFEISCEEGSNGGLEQSFVLVVWQDQDKQLTRNLTSSTPYFRVTDLAAGTNFTVQLYAVNEKGRGKPTVLRVPTLELMLDRVAFSVAPSSVGPVAALLSGAVLTVLLLLLAAGVLLTVRRRASAARRRTDSPAATSGPLTPTDKLADADRHTAVGPDIVPSGLQVAGRPLAASLVGSCLPETDISSPYYRKRWQTAVDVPGSPADSQLVPEATEPPPPPSPLPPPPPPPPPPPVAAGRITFTRGSQRQSFV